MNRPDQAPAHEQELRIRAAARLARRRAFFTTLAITGSLFVLNLFFYAQSHNSVWLLLDLVFGAAILLRAYAAFGPDTNDAKIRAEVDRMRSQAGPQTTAAPPPNPAPRQAPASPDDMWK
jgi:hypothetical protein